MSSDLMGRIARIYAAIGEAATTDPSEFTPVTRRIEGNLYETSVRFDGGMSNEQMQNAVYSAIHNVANLRDHLKKWARQNGKSTDVVDQAVEGSLKLKVIIDLSNRDKHGGPPRDGGLSGMSPDLVRFHRGLTAIHQGANVTAATIDYFGEAPQVQFGEGAAVVTSADVIDASGMVIGDAMAFLEAGALKWELALAEYGVALDQTSG